MKLLALDTSTEACSVALAIDGVVEESFAVVAQQHSQQILPMVDQRLAAAGLRVADLDGIAFGRGPGSFTGLRIGAGVVQGLAFSADIPVLPISSLAALAQDIDADAIVAAFDARMDQVYVGYYRRNANGLVESVDSEQVIAPEVVEIPRDGVWVGAGSGFDRYGAVLSARLGSRLQRIELSAYPHARAIARLGAAAYAAGGALPAEAAIPVYVRDRVARKMHERE